MRHEVATADSAQLARYVYDRGLTPASRFRALNPCSGYEELETRCSVLWIIWECRQLAAPQAGPGSELTSAGLKQCFIGQTGLATTSSLPQTA
jgi:hypothetical protein